MTDPNDNLDKLRKWLGDDGISFFREIKKKHGRVDACWIEVAESEPSKTSLADAIDRAQFPGIPHSVHFREGMQVRNFLRSIYGNSWTDHDYDNRWAGLVDEAIAGAKQGD